MLAAYLYDLLLCKPEVDAKVACEVAEVKAGILERFEKQQPKRRPCWRSTARS